MSYRGVRQGTIKALLISSAFIAWRYRMDELIRVFAGKDFGPFIVWCFIVESLLRFWTPAVLPLPPPLETVNFPEDFIAFWVSENMTFAFLGGELFIFLLRSVQWPSDIFLITRGCYQCSFATTSAGWSMVRVNQVEVEDRMERISM